MPATEHDEHRDVLLLGADELIVALVEHGLTAAGFRVTAAGDEQEAGRLTREARPEVVVVDVAKPAFALDVVRRLDGAGDGAAPTRFVFLTPRGAPAAVLADLRERGHEFVSKPFDLEELVARVRAQPTLPDVTVPTAGRARRYVLPLAALAAVAVAAGAAAGVAAARHDRAAPVPTAAAPVPTAAASRAPAAATPAATATHAAARPTPAATTSPRDTPAQVPCNDPGARGRAALGMLRDAGWAADVRVSFRSGRSDVLAVAHVRANAVTVYVRTCAKEPLRQVAAALVDQVAQVRATRWSAATIRRWMRLRGIDGTSNVAFAADVGAVAIVWQLHTLAWWRSPFPPPPRVSPGLVSLLRS